MTYTHLTTDELVIIESYFKNNQSVAKTAQCLGRARQTIHNVYQFLKTGATILNYYQQYKENKKRCGRRSIALPEEQKEYVQKRVVQGWTPDVIVGRSEMKLGCSVRTLYRMFQTGTLNGHQEKRGKQAFRRSIHERIKEHPKFENEFGHLEGDTIVGRKHKSAVITLVERLSKVIITLKPAGRQAMDIENRINHWFQTVPKHLFKSITFDCGKEFSNWKAMGNQNDIDIYFADPGTPSQRALNEHSNGLLRCDGLVKAMDFNEVSESFIQAVASKRNHIPRKSLKYQTSMEIFLRNIKPDDLSNLI